MPIVAIFKGTISKSQYDDLRKKVDWEGRHPQGAIVHIAGFDETDQIHVIDVWESAEALNTFVENRLLPELSKIDPEPEGAMVYQVHNINALSAIDKFKI